MCRKKLPVLFFAEIEKSTDAQHLHIYTCEIVHL